MTRTGLAMIAVLAVAVCAGLVRPDAAHACSCAAAPDNVLLAQADAVFAGTVVARAEYQPDARVIFSGAPVAWTFSVDTVVKGTVAPDQRVVSVLEGASCGFSFAVGRRYLVFTNAATGAFLEVAPGAGLATSLCSGNRGLGPRAPVPDLRMLPPTKRYPIYWIGPTFSARVDTSFVGLVLDRVSEHRGRVAFDYRECGSPTCGIALRIRTVHTCRAPGARLVPVTGLTTIRGVPAGRRGRAFVLFTGTEQVRIAADGGLARQAARALLAANRPGRTSAQPLHEPAPWALREGRACPVSVGSTP